MNNTLLRKGAALFLGCFYFVSCSKSSQLAELNDDAAKAKTAQQLGRNAEAIPALPYAPMPKDSIELMATNNPQDQ
ncbi:MAG: hypothetical protein EOO16_20415 [Chitinophagaceae bacterium]|nr:MAG: hypothetical protein EOO16_20415 [Chitinophagaceae bacterium]